MVTVDLGAAPRILAALRTPPNLIESPEDIAALPLALRGYAACWVEAAAVSQLAIERVLKVALALQRGRTVSTLTFADVLGSTGSTFSLAVQCDVEAVGLGALRMALTGAPLFLQGARGPSDPLIQHLAMQIEWFRRILNHLSLDQLTLALVRAAQERDIPWLRLGIPHRFVQLGHGRHGRHLHETLIGSTSAFAVRLTTNKAATNQLLARLGYPVPQQFVVHDAEDAVRSARRLGFPVVVKPCHGSKGHAVAVGLADDGQIRQAFAAAAAGGDSVVVEAVVRGDDHRLLVVAGKLIAAAQRRAARVVGDGRSTIRELVDLLNSDSRRGRDYERLMDIVDIDRETVDVLGGQQLSLETVLSAGRTASLRRTANISRGGSAVDLTDSIHPDNVQLAEGVALATGLDVAGIDFLTPDLSRSWREVGGGVIEVNGNPGLRPHWIADPARDVVNPILELLVPQGAATRIPSVMVTGSIGKTTTCRMVAHILRCSGKRVGLTTTMGVLIDDTALRHGDFSGGTAAENLLLHPELDAAVFEVARGGLIKSGMVIDRCDVAAVLNVLDNHLGLDGVHSREEMARVKRIIAEHASQMVVLNADDALCLAMRPHIGSPLCLVSRRPDHPELAAHRASGGCVVMVEGEGGAGRIVLFKGDATIGIMEICAIPATFEGRAMGKAVNAAFAIGIAHGLGMPFSSIAAALGVFAANYSTNPGRMNFFSGRPFGVLLDWTDGPEAAAELAAVARQLPISGERWLVLTAVGNRPDEFIVAMGRAVAGSFAHHVCSNYSDLRGRQAPDVPALLHQGLLDGGVVGDRIRCTADLRQAIEDVFARAQASDLVVIATYDTELAWQLITGADHAV
ncbi:MAG: Mur ligase family protein [Sulfuritalea sp.]|nr:Mur ligase family protein [Sulfuritalea sp.]